MPIQQLVDLSVINRALSLHEDTPLATTIQHIAQLVAFKINHESCSTVVFKLQDEAAKTRVMLVQKMDGYLRRRLELARQQSARLFEESRQWKHITALRAKQYPRYQSFEQFMREEFDIKMQKIQNKRATLKRVVTVEEYYLPVGQVIRKEKERHQKWGLQFDEPPLSANDFV